ncbi:hypothetical protein [Candidatus Regiella endosymbiont of Tuberolachnus salignus]|uniref:hypothetical protein n=1 Tax=Candidatus Regiella endosymbiont of Tuberolachnus salignus TaxID=3077956 RepID=UPI0030CFCB40
MLISLMALSPQRKLHSGLSGQIKLAIYGLLSLALTNQQEQKSDHRIGLTPAIKDNVLLIMSNGAIPYFINNAWGIHKC